MDTNQIENLLEAIKQVCSLDISILSTRRQIFLMVIKYPYQENFELNEWAIVNICPLHWKKINPLIKKAPSMLLITILSFPFSFFILFKNIFYPILLT